MTLRERLRRAVETVREAVGQAAKATAERAREFADGIAEIRRLVTGEPAAPAARPAPAAPAARPEPAAPAARPAPAAPVARPEPAAPAARPEPAAPAARPEPAAPAARPEPAAPAARPEPRPLISGRALDLLRELEALVPVVSETNVVNALVGYRRGFYKDGAKVLRHLDRKLRVWVTPKQLWLLTEIPYSSIRRELRRLLALGFIETNGQGKYSLPVDKLRPEDLPPNSDRLRRSGFRWWVRRNGDFGCAIFDPKKDYHIPKIFSGRSVGKGRVAGYSKERGRDLRVLGYSTAEPFEIVDRDMLPRKLPAHALAMQRTERGCHLLFRRGEVPKNFKVDTQYRRASLNRQTWNERLYNTDGTRRALWVALTPDGESWVEEHNAAMAEAWEYFEADKQAA